MINLLPHDLKEDIAYARRNAHLRNWIIASLVALIGVGVIVAGGLLYLHQSVNSYTKQVSSARTNLESQEMEKTQKRVAEISSNTKLTTQVLSREILFSKLIRKIGFTLPANTSLVSLKIDKVQGGIQLDAGAADFNAGSQIQVNLQDPKNGVFEKADINSISCGDEANNNPERNNTLPCTVSIRALFGQNNEYVYIAPTGGKKQ